MTDVGDTTTPTPEQLAALNTSDHRPDVYQDADGKWVFRMSQLSACTKSLVGAALDFPMMDAPENIRGRMDESTMLESELLRRAADGDYEWWGSKSKGVVKWTQRDPNDPNARRLIGPMIRVGEDHQFKAVIGIGPRAEARGSLDDIGDVYLRGPRTPFPSEATVVVVEGKCLGPDMFKSFLKKGRAFKGEYEGQHDRYIVAAKTGAVDPDAIIGVFVVGEKLYDEHETRKDGKQGKGVGMPHLGRVVVQIITETAHGIGEVKSAGFALLSAIDRALETGDMNDCDHARFPCPFYGVLCDKVAKDGADDVPLLDGVEDGEDAEHLRLLMHQYRVNQQLESKHKGLKDGYKDELLKLIKKHGKTVGEDSGPCMGWKDEWTGEWLIANNVMSEGTPAYTRSDEELEKMREVGEVKGKDFVIVKAWKDHPDG